MRKMVTLFFIFGMSVMLCAKSSTLPGVIKPGVIAVDDKNFYISDAYNNSIQVYTLENFKLTAKFGKKGEGPGEFKYSPLIFLTDAEIHALTLFKYFRFSKQGILLDEKYVGLMGTNNVQILGENFVISRWFFAPSQRTEIVLVSKKFEKIKNLYESPKKGPKQKEVVNLISPKISIGSSGDNLYLADANKGLYIEVYDITGKKVRTIEKEYQKLKISDKRKQQLKERFWNVPRVKKSLSYVKKWTYNFPEFFPALDEILVADGKIFVRTYNLKNGKIKYLVMDKEGKILRSIFLPETLYHQYAIRNGIFYYLKENEDNENWEIHAIEIDHVQ